MICGTGRDHWKRSGGCAKIAGRLEYSKAHFVCNKLVFPAFATYKKPEKKCALLYISKKTARTAHDLF
jgi:hypothetical protein